MTTPPPTPTPTPSDERWLPVYCDPRYEVSDLGRVRVVRTGHVLKPYPNAGNYLRVNIGGRMIAVHKIVLTTFVGVRPDRHEGAHLNGDRHDNRLNNLEWLSHAENEAQRQKHGRVPRGSKCYNAKLTEDSVVAIRSLAASGVDRKTIARAFGVHRVVVQRILGGEGWSHVA